MRGSHAIPVLVTTLLWVAPMTAGADEYRSLVQAATTASNADQPAIVDRATARRIAADGLDETRARIAVHRDIAAVFGARESWVDAAIQISTALTLARNLGDPDLLISLYLEEAGHRLQADTPALTRQLLDSADAMISRLDRREAWVESRLLRAASLAKEARSEDRLQADAIYDELLAAPDADRYRIELHRARHTRLDRPEIFAARWTTVLDLARRHADPATEAEACDRLGTIAHSLGDYPRAARLFAQAEDTAAPLNRTMGTWLDVIAAYNHMDDRPRAHRALAAAAELITDAGNPGAAADLHEARGQLLGREGDFASAFRELGLAMELRRRRDATRQVTPFARITPMANPRNLATAAELAAVRNALREAELDRTRLLARQTAGVATVAALAAALLGLAYAYKRRSAAVLATARDNAELRADRTHWQMLRYQLNPHFLFNALSSLGGLVATDPAAAGRVVDRLSEFCQLALKGANDDLRTVEDELRIIRAYLDVEQAGAGDSLVVRIDVQPSTLPCLLPPLLLQPLVENALKYGGRTSEDHLEIRVAARLGPAGRDLELEVSNTGRWIQPGTTPRERDAVGLANVRERLARFAGPSADLTFAHDGHWVRAKIRLPARSGPPAAAAP